MSFFLSFHGFAGSNLADACSSFSVSSPLTGEE
jgi:hypothetical protein